MGLQSAGRVHKLTGFSSGVFYLDTNSESCRESWSLTDNSPRS